MFYKNKSSSFVASTHPGLAKRRRVWQSLSFLNINISAIIRDINMFKLLDESVGFPLPLPFSHELLRDSQRKIGAWMCRVTRCRKYPSHEIFHCDFFNLLVCLHFVKKQQPRNHKGPSHHNWGSFREARKHGEDGVYNRGSSCRRRGRRSSFRAWR